MPTTYAKELNRLLESPCTSVWLKEAIQTLLDRDPVDAWADAQTLVLLMEARELAAR